MCFNALAVYNYLGEKKIQFNKDVLGVVPTKSACSQEGSNEDRA